MPRPASERSGVPSWTRSRGWCTRPTPLGVGSVARVATARGESTPARLARLGFTDPTRAAAALAGGALGAYQSVVDDDEVLRDVAGTADPDQALTALALLLDADGSLAPPLRADEVLRHRLLSVLGASRALGDHLLRMPEGWHILNSDRDVRPSAAGLRRKAFLSVGADPDIEPPVLIGGARAVPSATDMLRL